MPKNSKVEELENRIRELEKTESEYKEGKEMIKQLQLNEERFRKLYEEIPLGYQSLDLGGRFIEVNKPWLDLMDYSRSEVIGHWFGEFLAPNEVESFKKRFLKFVESGEVHTDMQMLKRDGSEVTIHFDGRIGKDERGEFKQTHCILHDITKHKQAEEALRQSEEKYRNLIESVQEGIWVIDNDSMTTFANIPMADMLGYTVGEMVGRHLFSFMDEIGVKSAKRFLERREKGIKEQHEFEFLKKDGERIYVLMETMPITDKSGNYNGAIAGVINITDRKQAQEALRESENRFKMLAESTFEGILVHEGGKILDMNKNFEEMFGFKRSELIYEDAIKLVAPESRDLVANKIRNEDSQPYEAIGLRKDGSTFIMEINARMVDYGSKRVRVAVCRDITEHKRAEEALRESELKFRSITEQTSDMISLTDEKGVITYVSPSSKKIFDFQPEEMIGHHFMEFLAESAIPIATSAFRKAISSGIQERNLELLMKRKDGSHFYGELSGALFDSMNKQGALAVIRDITDRKRMEEELLKTQKLESLGILAGGIAHDFNNILSTMIGNISIAKMQILPSDEVFELLSEAETASKRAQTLTKQLLTFAKGGAPVKETVQLGDVIKESSYFVLRGSKSDCEFSIAEDLWTVDVDVGQITQVINNIVINANQAMPDGGTIKISAENLIIDKGNQWQLKPGRYIWISVKDEGTGIAAKHISRIFDPYFTTKQEGSGLGLSTSHSIVKNHAGHIKVESELGIGTTFFIYLPASEKAAPVKEEIRVMRGQGRILVMDDEESLRKMMGRMLDKLGYESAFAKDGEEAIEMVKEAKEAEKPYDAIILDLTVPGGMGGKETIQKLLAIDPYIKAIVSSGYSEDPVLANFQEHGFKGVIPKPFESLALSRVLYKVLQK